METSIMATVGELLYVAIVTEQACHRAQIEQEDHAWAARIAQEAEMVWNTRRGVGAYVVFDGPPGPESGRFVEVEDVLGNGLSVGKWEEMENGMWRLGPFLGKDE
jgi:hypothetical protein